MARVSLLHFFVTFLALMTFVPTHWGLAASPQAIASVEELWQGFDPKALPLDIDIIRTWEESGAVLQRLRFTGEVAGGTRVRVYAIQGAPRDGSKLPGVLHVHGGGQTASLDWVRFWARRGYVCVSFDYCGKWDTRTDFTDWGPIKHGNMAQASGGFQLRPTPRESSWYHWALVSRRALTLLASHPRVDPERLGVFGISTGGTLTWMIAGTDRRVKAAVPIYGCGYNYDRRNVVWGLPPPSADLILFQRFLSSEAYAPYISCPVLFLSASNDFHGIMDRAYETLASTPSPTRQAFTPRTNHHLEARQGGNLPLWMDWHLKSGPAWPKTPEVRVTLDRDGIVMATIISAAEVAKVEVFYSLGDKRPQARFWRKAKVIRKEKGWEAPLPVLDTWGDVHVFANVTYKSGVCLSSQLRHVIPAQIGKARATLKWSSKWAEGESPLDYWVFTNGYTDPSVSWSYLEAGADPAVGPFVTFNARQFGDPIEARLSTHIIGDPQFQGGDGLALAFKCRGEFSDEGLTVSVVEDDWGPHSRTYSAKVPMKKQKAGWQDVILPLEKFVDAGSKAPVKWQTLDKLEIRGKAARRDPPCFARFSWSDTHVHDGKGKTHQRSAD